MIFGISFRRESTAREVNEMASLSREGQKGEGNAEREREREREG